MKLAFKQRMNKILAGQRSLAAFARKAGISQPVMYKYANGDSMPGTVNLVATAKAAGVAVKWLATGEGPETESLPRIEKAEACDVNQEAMCKSIELLRVDLRCMNMSMADLSDDDLSKLLIVYYDSITDQIS